MPRPRGFTILWSYEVAAAQIEDFESGYAPDGDWARLFGRAQGYRGTELLRASPGHYVTIDRWRSEADFEAFQREFGEAYRELDARCEGWTLSEQLIGRFTELQAEGP